jgi:hypothetical protein
MKKPTFPIMDIKRILSREKSLENDHKLSKFLTEKGWKSTKSVDDLNLYYDKDKKLICVCKFDNSRLLYKTFLPIPKKANLFFNSLFLLSSL